MELKDLIRLNRAFIKGRRHRDFERVTALSHEYKAHLTGIGLDDYLRQFNLREDDAMFDQAATTLHLTSQQINWAHLQALAWADQMTD